MNPQELELDPETLAAQRAARALLKHDTKILTVTFFVFIFLLFILYKPLPFTLALLPPFLFIFYVVNIWRQWNALIVHKLRCPHCGERLAEHVHLLYSPSSKCRHCKQPALASTSQLEKTE